MKTRPLAALALSLTTAACSSLPTEPPATDAHAAAAPPTRAELEALPMFDGHTGTPVTMATLQSAIDHADIVVLGELHGHPVGLPFDAALYADALERHPGAALCLEFLTRDTQLLLDEYLTDLRTFDELVEALKDVRGASANDHAPLIDLAKAAGAPVLAANAPRTYTTFLRTEGEAALERLTAHQRAHFDVPPVLPGGGYRERFFETMAPMFTAGGIHAEEGAPDAAEDAAAEDPRPLEERLDAETRDKVLGMFRAQTLWDGTMSASVVNAWRAGHGPAFLVIGSFHVNHDGGTLQLIRERAPEARVVVITFEDTSAPALRDEDRGIADFVVYVGAFDD